MTDLARPVAYFLTASKLMFTQTSSPSIPFILGLPTPKSERLILNWVV